MQPVHSLEAWVRKVFRVHFASIILHGLHGGGDDISVECIDERGRKGRRTLSVMTPESQRWGYKPLVLAALLKLQLDQQEIESTLDFSPKDVLRELMWPDLPACRREVEDAVGFYMWCSYSRSDLTVEGDDRYEIRSACKMLTRFKHEGDFRPQGDMIANELYKVSFDPELVEALRRGRISFAGLSFGRLASGSNETRAETESEPDVMGERSPQYVALKRGAPTEQPLCQPGPRPVVRIKLTPVSQRSADGKSKMWARAVGETEISFDTGAIASAVLRALHRTAARHPVAHQWPYESCEAIAENVHREVDKHIRHTAYSVVRQVRRRVFEDALLYSYGLMHSMVPVGSYGERGTRPIWYSPDHFLSSLMRAIEAIEFDRWKPKRRVTPNRRWRVSRIRTATIIMVAAYWAEAEGNDFKVVDSGRMSKWLKSLGLPRYSILRSNLRRKIAERRRWEATIREYGGNVWAFMVFGDLPDGLKSVTLPG